MSTRLPGSRAHSVFRRYPAVLLRRERWGGFAFQRDLDELLELDEQGDLQAISTALKWFIEQQPTLRLYVDTALRGEWSLMELFDDPEPEVLGCGGGQRHVAITPEGDVYPCSHARRSELRMGNLLRDGLRRIWDQEPGRAARQRYLNDCHGTACPCRG